MSKKILFGLVLISAALAGCTTTANPTYTASGMSGYRINCGGIFGDGDLGSCYQKAGELCESNGYRVQQTGVSSLIVACKNDVEEVAVTPAR